jgi:hypothetical protein
MLVSMEDLSNVLKIKQSACQLLSKQAKYYNDEVYKIKKRKQKEALKKNDGTLQDEGDDFKICTGKRPYICFAKNSEIDPALQKETTCKCIDSKINQKQKAKNREWVEGKCSTCSHTLCKICRYDCSSCKAIICQDCYEQCTNCFNFCCEKCECLCGTLQIKLLR